MKRCFFSGLILLLLFLISCKKDNSSSQSNILTDQLSESQLQILNSAPLDTITKYTDLIFADGRNISDWGLMNDTGFIVVLNLLSVSEKKELFIQRMSEVGFHLTDDLLCSCFPLQANGLAYVWGSKKTSVTYIDPSVVCQQPLYGLDCSGMIYQMAVGSQLSLDIGGTVNYAQTSVWNKAFNNSVDFQGLEMKDLSTLAPSQLQAGDIIVVSGVHMGMVYNSGNGTIGILNSQGSPKYTCAQNSDQAHGPVKRSNVQSWLTNLFPDNNYHVLRVVLNGSPGVTTANITSVGSSSALTGGNVTSQGSSQVTMRGVCWSTNPDPTTANSKTLDGPGMGSFTSSITGLNPGTQYYLRAYATNSDGTSYGNPLNFITNQSGNSGTVTDIDGNVYNTVTIGTQVWMKENLKTTRYRNGNTIPTNLSDAQWHSTTTGAYSIYNNDPNNNNKYGKLYNWYAASDSRNIAPVGWHVPTAAEWETLINYLGGASVAGGKLKAVSALWNSPNTGATNSSGFTGLPSGFRDDGNWPGQPNVKYGGLGTVAEWWTKSLNPNPSSPPPVLDYAIYNSSATIFQAEDYKGVGFAVRCIKD